MSSRGREGMRNTVVYVCAASILLCSIELSSKTEAIVAKACGSGVLRARYVTRTADTATISVSVCICDYNLVRTTCTECNALITQHELQLAWAAHWMQEKCGFIGESVPWQLESASATKFAQ